MTQPCNISASKDPSQPYFLDWFSARLACRRRDHSLVSLTNAKARRVVKSLLRSSRMEKVWVGGRVSRGKTGLFWENGLAETVIRLEIQGEERTHQGGRLDEEHNCLAVKINSQVCCGL